MELLLNIDLKKLPQQISYGNKIMLIGSCFTEHIGNSLADLKFDVLQNPNGILFDPLSVSASLLSYTKCTKYNTDSLFHLDELWHSWDYHSKYSGPVMELTLERMNSSVQVAHDFLKHADWLVVTLGSAFIYRLTRNAEGPAGKPVANCHRAPATWFEKQLLPVQTIITSIEDCIGALKNFNPDLKIIFTISPVRHIRDGVVENNRSKSRLIESVHHIIANNQGTFYFPAYELVIDVLRDYRFYDIDLVHPNYAATNFVMGKFAESCIDDQSRQIMEDVKSIITARKHKAFHPTSMAHVKFMTAQFEKAGVLMRKYPFLDLSEELQFFSRT